MAELGLARISKYFRFGDENDCAVPDGGRLVGRIFVQPASADGATLVLVDHGYGREAVSIQSRLFGTAGGSDGEFQNAAWRRSGWIMPLSYAVIFVTDLLQSIEYILRSSGATLFKCIPIPWIATRWLSWCS